MHGKNASMHKGLLGLMLLAGVSMAARAQEDEETRRLTEEARKVSQGLIAQIGGELKKEYELSGPLRSIIVCKYTAPEVSSAVSRKSGALVKRVSLRVRNPLLGSADAWEQKALQEFDKRLARGEKPETIEQAEVVTEPQGRYFRYIKAIPMGPLCVNCHGPVEQMTEATRAQLAAEYPHDKAVGYSLGQIRGGVTYKKPL